MPLRKVLSAMFVAMLLSTSGIHGKGPQRHQNTTRDGGKRAAAPAAFVHHEDEGRRVKGDRKRPGPIPAPFTVEVFKDSDAWFGENREEATLQALGRMAGDTYYVHPLSELVNPIPAAAAVVILPSNGQGLAAATQTQNDPVAQASLGDFVRAGGVLVVDMGDNDTEGSYMAPGAVGSPEHRFPEPGDDATLAAEALGSDGLLGTADDHPLVRGPDGVAGTADDLNNTNIDMCCFVAHGNVADGLALPASTIDLMTATFEGVQKPILAEYCLGYGRVIVDTITKEYSGHEPQGTGPSQFLLSLFSYALDPRAHVPCQLEGLMASVRSMIRSGSLQANLLRRLAKIDLANADGKNACGGVRAFENRVINERGRGIPAVLSDEWLAVTARMRAAMGCGK
jgi:hypothetical protein